MGAVGEVRASIDLFSIKFTRSSMVQADQRVLKKQFLDVVILVSVSFDGIA
jgi:hypothetical protein